MGQPKCGHGKYILPMTSKISGKWLLARGMGSRRRSVEVGRATTMVKAGSAQTRGRSRTKLLDPSGMKLFIWIHPYMSSNNSMVLFRLCHRINSKQGKCVMPCPIVDPWNMDDEPWVTSAGSEFVIVHCLCFYCSNFGRALAKSVIPCEPPAVFLRASDHTAINAVDRWRGVPSSIGPLLGPVYQWMGPSDN